MFKVVRFNKFARCRLTYVRQPASLPSIRMSIHLFLRSAVLTIVALQSVRDDSSSISVLQFASQSFRTSNNPGRTSSVFSSVHPTSIRFFVCMTVQLSLRQCFHFVSVLCATALLVILNVRSTIRSFISKFVRSSASSLLPSAVRSSFFPSGRTNVGPRTRLIQFETCSRQECIDGSNVWCSVWIAGWGSRRVERAGRTRV